MKDVKVFGKGSVSEWINFILRIVWISVVSIFFTAIIVYLLLILMEGFDQVLIKLQSQTHGEIKTKYDFFTFVIRMAIYLGIVWGLKKLFRNLQEEKIFITKNVYYIRVIALAFLIKAFIPKFSLEGIFIAAVIFVLGEIFKVGDNLKKEVDSIV